MINFIHSRFHRPERGWDPITPEYAAVYARQVASVDLALLAHFERFCGGFAGKTVTDVGSGPGQYALEFARRGAKVVCLDVSRNYLRIAEARLKDAGYPMVVCCAYIDEIQRLSGAGVDAIFSNVSWYYCRDDRRFAKALWNSVRIGGAIGIRASNGSYEPRRNWRRRSVYFLNDHFGWKIGHPHPPHGRIASEFKRLGPCVVEVDYSDSRHDVVFIRRTG